MNVHIEMMKLTKTVEDLTKRLEDIARQVASLSADLGQSAIQAPKPADKRKTG